ncbi:isocitrate/isopropylmalate dehydrogenase family protein [archaeon]|nr:MAG: isocitrate/isopropylmalate dehydrogenase family protein [archaeon]
MKYSIATIPGDGIGTEVMAAAVKVLEALAEKTGLEFEFRLLYAGDEHKERTGVALPPETIEGVKASDACLFAAVGNTAKEVIIPLRQRLNLYANLRPAKAYPGVPAVNPDVDIMIVRENTEGIYKMIGDRGRDYGFNVRVITREASERIVRYAFEYARRNGKSKVSAVHKANVLDYTDDVFLEAARDVAKDYPGIAYEEVIVDACAMKLVLSPQQFQVIVTTNMFGDILSDEAAGLVGGLGMAPSGNVGDELCIFEPVHGSAPDIAGKGIANPVATILSAAMMLEWLGEKEAADRLEAAVLKVLEEGEVRTPDLGGANTTDDVADAVIERL